MKLSRLNDSLRKDWQDTRLLCKKPHHNMRMTRPLLTKAPALAAILAVCWCLGGCLGRLKSPQHVSARREAPSSAILTVESTAPSAGTQNFALTFDDGPHAVHTPALLDWLKTHQIHATFFVLGERAERHPELVRRMVAEGHEVANHSWSHPNLRLMSTTRMLQQVRRTHDLITKLTGRPPMTFRPPYGSLSTTQKKRIEKEFGYQVVLWTVDTLDWKLRSADQVAGILRAEVKDRSIVLAHDIHGHILPALDDLQPHFKRLGLQPQSVREMLRAPASKPLASVR